MAFSGWLLEEIWKISAPGLIFDLKLYAMRLPNQMSRLSSDTIFLNFPFSPIELLQYLRNFDEFDHITRLPYVMKFTDYAVNNINMIITKY